VLRQRIIDEAHAAYDAKVAHVGAPIMRHVEKDVMLRMLDQHWREHLAAMDYLRQGIHLRGYAQKDYRYEYKREAFELFAAMLDRVKLETVTMLAKIEVRTQEDIDREAQHAEAHSALEADGAGGDARAPAGALPAGLAGAVSGTARGGAARPVPPPPAESQGTFVRSERKIGRNEPCPCGSGKKFKHCHGTLSSVE
jgi:preprotein translocase subunit SecA